MNLHQQTRDELVQTAMQALEKNDYATIKLACQALTSRFPDQDTSVYRLWAAACFQTNQLSQAEQILTNATQLESIPSNYFNLALVKEALNKEQEAIAAYLQVIKQQPDFADAYNNLANLYANQHQLQEAKQYYQKTLTINPHHVFALKNLAMIHKSCNDLPNTLHYLKQTVAIDPEFKEAWNELGLILEKQGDLPQAEQAFQKAGALSAVIRIMRKMVSWDQLAQKDQQVLQAIEHHLIGIEPLTIINIPTLTRSLHQQAAKQLAELCYNPKAPPFYQKSVNLLTNKKLKIGYLSGNFCDHPVTRLLIGVLEHHNTHSFDFFLYDYSPKQINHYTQRLTNLAYPTRNITQLSDRQAAQLIANDQIDILIDLQGYTEGARLTINALRPAPVIINWLGYAGTLGSTRLADFLIGDPITTPIEHASSYMETLALLPHCYLPSDNSKLLINKPSRQQAGLPKKGFVFCSFNQLVKINPETFNLWCQLLFHVQDSVLWLSDPNNEQIKHRLIQEAEKRGISSQRIIFAPRVAEEKDHLERLQLADLALDTYPYNSHTTAIDALWAGVPLITKQGELFASRVGASVLTACNLSNLITKDDNSYLQLAIQLATNTARYQATKQQLLNNRSIAPLFNTVTFTQDLEQLYLKVWERACHTSTDKTPIKLS